MKTVKESRLVTFVVKAKTDLALDEIRRTAEIELVGADGQVCDHLDRDISGLEISGVRSLGDDVKRAAKAGKAKAKRRR